MNNEVENPYRPTIESTSNQPTRPLWGLVNYDSFRWRFIPIGISTLFIVLASFAITTILVFTIYRYSVEGYRASLDRGLIPRVAISLLLLTVNAFVNSLAVYRWHRGHFYRALLYNVVATFVLLGPLTYIPLRLLNPF